jgi:hypothetical protein
MCDDRQLKKLKQPANSTGQNQLVLSSLNDGQGQIRGSYNGDQLASLQPGIMMPPYWNPWMNYNSFQHAPPLMAPDSFIHNQISVPPMSGSRYHMPPSSFQINMVNDSVPNPPSADPIAINTNLNEIRANISRINAEIAIIARMRELRRNSLSLAAMRNGQGGHVLPPNQGSPQHDPDTTSRRL